MRGRPKQFSFAKKVILARIAQAQIEACDVFAAEWRKRAADPHDTRRMPAYSSAMPKRLYGEILSIGTPYNLPLFVGRELSPSERIAAQKFIRTKLAHVELVALHGDRTSHIRLTAAGWAKVGVEPPASDVAHFQYVEVPNA